MIERTPFSLPSRKLTRSRGSPRLLITAITATTIPALTKQSIAWTLKSAQKPAMEATVAMMEMRRRSNFRCACGEMIHLDV